MAEESFQEDLDECHEDFACEVVRALNKFYSLPIDPVSKPYKVKYLTEGICWGILTISYLLHEKNQKVFKSLRKSLKNENFFYECCMFIPTEKNGKFFFNFLKRVSRIYEMALFCYRNEDDYIKTARNCIAQFQDKEYFESAGSWERLDRIGSFLNCWSKQLRPVMLPELRRGVKNPESEDIDSLEDLPSDIICPVEQEREYNSTLLLLLVDETADVGELGSIEDEIKSIVRYIKTFFPHLIVSGFKEFPVNSKSQNGSGAEASNPQTLSTRHEAVNPTKSEAENTKRKATSLLCERLAEEMAASLREKLTMKAKCEELVRIVEETEAIFRRSLDPSKCTLTPRSDSSNQEKNERGYSSILEHDLYLSSSSTDDNSERPIADENCDENKIPPGEDLHQSSDENTSGSSSDSSIPEKRETNSTDEEDFIKYLERDLYFKAETFAYDASCIYTDSDSDVTEPYSARNSTVDEGDASEAENNNSSFENESSDTNIKPKSKSEAENEDLPLAIPTGSSAGAPIAAEEDSDSSSDTDDEEQLTSPTKKAQSNLSEAAEKPNASNESNAKQQKRKTKRRKKKGKGKK